MKPLDDLLWEFLLKEHDLYDEFLVDEGGKIFMKKQSPWLKTFFKDLKETLLDEKNKQPVTPVQEEAALLRKASLEFQGIRGKRKSR